MFQKPSVRSGALALAAMLALLLVFYEAMVFRGEEPVSGDTAAAESFHAWSSARVEAGELPHWYPYIFLGMPSYGSFIYTPGSPLSWMHRTFDMGRGLRYVVWFMIGAAGAMLMMRRLGAGWPAAFAATFAIIFTPYMVGSLNAGHSSKLMAMAFAPLVFWAVDRLLARASFTSVGLAAIAIALQLWSNHPQVVFYTWLVVGPFAVVRLVVNGTGAARVRGVALLAVAVGLAVAMVALPYWPVYEYAHHSTRGAPSALPGASLSGTQSWDYATMWSFSPKELVSFVVPGAFGMEGRTYWGFMPFTQSTHAIGIVPLLLSIVGFAVMRGWRRIFFLVAIGAILVIGFGRHLPLLYRPLYELAPFFDKFRVPSMIYAMLPLVCAPAIAVGFDHLAGGKPERSRLVTGLLAAMGVLLLVGVILAGGAGAGAGHGWLVKPGQPADPTLVGARHDILTRDVLRVALLGGLVMLAALLRARGRIGRLPFVAAALALLVVDLFTLDRAFYAPVPPVSAEELGADPAVVADLREGTSPVRVLPLELSVRDGQLVPELDQGSVYPLAGIQSVGGYHAAGLRRMKDFILAGLWANSSLWPMLDAEFVVVTLRARLSETQRAQLRGNLVAMFPGLELVGIHSTRGGEVAVFRNATLGRAFFVPRARAVPDAAERIEALGSPAFDPAAEALVESETYASGPGDGGEPARASLVSYEDERLEIRTTGGGGKLVVADAYYPGWETRIDGARAETHAANHVLRAVDVPAGEHTVVMTFTDGAYRTARLVSTVAKIACGLCLVVGVVGSRRRTVPSEAS